VRIKLARRLEAALEAGLGEAIGLVVIISIFLVSTVIHPGSSLSSLPLFPLLEVQYRLGRQQGLFVHFHIRTYIETW